MNFEYHDRRNVSLAMYPIFSMIALYKYLFVINLTASESKIDTKKCLEYFLVHNSIVVLVYDDDTLDFESESVFDIMKISNRNLVHVCFGQLSLNLLYTNMLTVVDAIRKVINMSRTFFTIFSISNEKLR